MALARYFLRRCIHALPLLFGLVTLVFFLSRMLPGDTASVMLSPTIPLSVAEQLRTEFGLERPLSEQYLLWLRELLKGNLGVSFTFSEPVVNVLGGVFPNTLLLGLSALLLELVIAVALTGLAVRRSGSVLDRCISRASLVVYALPSFWIGLLLLMIFSYGLGILPSSQMSSSGPHGGGDLIRHLLLPALTAALPGAASLARYLRTSIATTQQQEFVLAARSMGLSPSALFRSYLLPNSLGPFISQAGVEFGILLSGVVVTETLFAWPGMGRLLVLAVFARDYPLILGCAIVAGTLVVLGNLLADVLHAWIDPRLSSGSALQ